MYVEVWFKKLAFRPRRRLQGGLTANWSSTHPLRSRSPFCNTSFPLNLGWQMERKTERKKEKARLGEDREEQKLCNNFLRSSFPDSFFFSFPPEEKGCLCFLRRSLWLAERKTYSGNHCWVVNILCIVFKWSVAGLEDGCDIRLCKSTRRWKSLVQRSWNEECSVL